MNIILLGIACTLLSINQIRLAWRLWKVTKLLATFGENERQPTVLIGGKSLSQILEEYDCEVR